MHLVGSIIIIYHDARSPERQINILIRWVLFLGMSTALGRGMSLSQPPLYFCVYKSGIDTIKVGIELGTFSLTSSIQKFPVSKQTVNTNI